MFYNGSEPTLVKIFFSKMNNLPYEGATYTVVGVGDASTTYNAGEGNIYTVSLISFRGEIVNIKAI